MRLQTRAALALSVTSCLAAPSQLRLPNRAPNPDRANAVKEAFSFSWNGYYKYAFPNDELHPVSNGSGNSRNGWGASAVDALTTAILMEKADVVDIILTHISTVDYTKTSTEVSLFETTIRYLAGMLAGYDLLTGPSSSLAINKTNVPILLDQAKSLADSLKFAFNTSTGIPHNDLWFTNGTYAADNDENGLATIGSLVLEWTRLSDLLNDDTYAKLSQKGESYLLAPKPASSEPFPGLVGSTVNIDSGNFTDSNGGWGGGTDSFYEYLIKMYVYDPSRFGTYKDRWVLAADSTIANLTQHPEPRPDITFVADYSGQTRISTSGHLNCFIGGNFILGGTVLGEQKYIDAGLEYVDGCHNTYNSTATHIGPEAFGWDASKVPADQKDFFQKNGFFINTAYYDLRPEVIESYYYAYRVTGDTKYQDWAWDAFLAINSTCRAASGFAAINNVNTAGGGGYIDNQESFWFAEVMKYSYIIHVDDAAWQVSKDGKNSFVFNTEAHPLKVFSGSSSKIEAKQGRGKTHSA